MSGKYHLISVVCLFVILLCRPCLAVDTEPIGWATIAGGTTGGQGGEVVTVTNKAEFVSAVSGDTPRIVQVVGTIHGDYNIPNVGSNKTIVGIGFDARIVGFSVKVTDLDNVIIRNITFQGAMPQDGLICRRATHLWIDHCTFFDAADGLCDLTDQCDYATVSWCNFYYTSLINPHRFTCLVGSTDDNPPDVGKLNITWHHNWWGNYADQRMPRVRYGQNHVFNNYYSCTGNSYCIGGSWGFKGLLENNYFDHVNNPMRDAGRVDSGSSGTFTVEIKSVDNIFDECTGSQSTYGDAFVPAYSYTLDPAADIPSIVEGGVGTTILIGDSALWPTKATVPTPANGEGNAAVDSTLTWLAGSTAVSHNVYFGASPAELVIVSDPNQTTTSFTPPVLTADTEYYWRIDEVAADESVITGDLWTFKTVPDLPTDLFHYWPFDVDFLDVAEAFASNPNNPFGAAWLDTDAKLLGGGCLDLTYQKDGLIAGWSESATNTIFPDTAPMSISLWFKPTELPAPDKTACMLGSKTGTESGAKTFRIELLPSGACRLTVDSATPEFGNSPTLNGWNHVLISIDASGQLSAWLNANEAGSITLATSASNDYNGQYTGIGFYGDDANGLHRGDYTGYIDDVAIWNVSSDLTFAEILYNDGIGRTVIGPVFTSDPINLDAVELSPYAGPSLAYYAYDLNGINTVTFSKDSGPSWLTVESDGTLSGIPSNTNVGSNIFTVRATDNGGLYDTATMTIDVANVYSGVLGMPDLAGLAAQWLESGCVDTPPCNGADLNGDFDVTIEDFAIQAHNWLGDESLQLYLKFDETTGDIAHDSSVYRQSGQLVNDPVWQPEGGQIDGAILFDGIDDYIDLIDFDGLNGAGEFSICFWIKPASLPFDGHEGIIGIGTGGQRAPWIWGNYNSYYLRMQFETTTGGVSDGDLQIGEMAEDTWTHIAVTWDGSTCSSYINGAFNNADGTTGNTLVVSDGVNYLGYIAGYGYWNGLIDEVRIYGVALDQTEIQAVMD